MDLEILCGELIVSAGEAKSCYIESMAASREGKFDEARKMIEEGKKAYLAGHKHHAKLLQLSTEENFTVTLLLMHVEDQMMNCESMEIVAEEIFALYQTIIKEV